MKKRTRFITAAFIALLYASNTGFGAEAAADHVFKVSEKTDELMAFYCYDCHDDARQKGDIRLDNLAELDNGKRLDLLNRMQEQLYFKHMPPEKKRISQTRQSVRRCWRLWPKNWLFMRRRP
ncbi:MAG: c-type cytochrome domain-containing protein [Akkermansiaceae bacterium]